MSIKMQYWFQNLVLFHYNSMIHCAREEKALNIKRTGTRQVNYAFESLLREMGEDLGEYFPKPLLHNLPTSDEVQLLVAKIGAVLLGFDLCNAHEVISINGVKEHIIRDSYAGNDAVFGLFNWCEGIVPLIQTNLLLPNQTVDENTYTGKYIIVYDIGKNRYGFMFDEIIQRFDIDNKRITRCKSEYIDSKISLDNADIYLLTEQLLSAILYQKTTRYCSQLSNKFINM